MDSIKKCDDCHTNGTFHCTNGCLCKTCHPNRVQAAIFLRVPYFIEDGKILFDSELCNAVTFGDMTQIGYLDYGREELAHVDIRVLVLKQHLLPKIEPPLCEQGSEIRCTCIYPHSYLPGCPVHAPHE